ncbi:MAG: tRNA (adenosine(37)-N6)-threonylcarbamoyltransferase complex dimerization subunit type 1 TsaB [Gammaproteobacteria bacterium]
MKLLSIEAAASPATVALDIDGSAVELSCDDPRAQAEQLLALIESLLDQQALSLNQLDGIAVGRGPGSFTGLRVAAALAQGLAYSAGLNIANVSSLAAVAHSVFNQQGSDATALLSPLLVCLDARKEQVYCGLYEADELGLTKLVSSEAVLDPAEVVTRFGGVALQGVGNGFSEYPELMQLKVPVLDSVRPSAAAIALRASTGAVEFEAPYLALPEYVRNNVTHGS